MKRLLVLAIVLLLSACGPEETIPRVDVNHPPVPDSVAQGVQP